MVTLARIGQRTELYPNLSFRGKRGCKNYRCGYGALVAA